MNSVFFFKHSCQRDQLVLILTPSWGRGEKKWISCEEASATATAGIWTCQLDFFDSYYDTGTSGRVQGISHSTSKWVDVVRYPIAFFSFFYVFCPLKTWAYVSLHNFLSSVDLKFAFLPSLLPSVQTILSDRRTISFSFPSCFQCPGSINFSNLSFFIMCLRIFSFYFLILSICPFCFLFPGDYFIAYVPHPWKSQHPSVELQFCCLKCSLHPAFTCI